MLVVGSEQLLGRQHTNILLLSFLLNKFINFLFFRSVYSNVTRIIRDNTVKRFLILLLFQLTGCPSGLTHSPPDKMELGNTH